MDIHDFEEGDELRSLLEIPLETTQSTSSSSFRYRQCNQCIIVLVIASFLFASTTIASWDHMIAMKQALSHFASVTRSFRNHRNRRHSFHQWTTASYHATSQCRFVNQNQDVELIPSEPNNPLNRPRINKTKLGMQSQKYGKNIPQIPDGADMGRYYASRFNLHLASLCERLWIIRFVAMSQGYTPQQEAQACAVCARHALPGQYPHIYYDLDLLADTLYILGRTDMEHDPKHRNAARFALDHATELGHLDAALLLHRLALADRSLSAGHAAERVIKKAKDLGDWRAKLAYIEQTKLRRIEQMTLVDIKETIWLLKDAMDAHSDSEPQQPKLAPTRISDLLNGRLDVDALESFDPPARHLWHFCRLHYKMIAALPEPDKTYILDLYEIALRQDADKHQNPEAMYALITLPEEMRSPALVVYSRLWSNGVKLAAASGIPEAMLNLGLYLLHERSLYPTLAMTSGEYQPDIKTDRVLWHHESAFEELRTAAQIFSSGRPDITAYLYMLMAGILSENGFHQDGQQLIQAGYDWVVGGSTSFSCNSRKKEKHAKLLKDLDDSWHKYRETGLYDDVRPARLVKNPAIAGILMLPDISQGSETQGFSKRRQFFTQ